MGAPGRQAIDEKMVGQLSTFIKVGDKRGLFGSPGGKALRVEIGEWIPKMEGAIDAEAVSEQHKAKIAPLLGVFERTHDRVASLSLLFQGWSRVKGNEVEVEALTGPLVVGEDEHEDEQKLRAWQPIFVKLYGAAALPLELQNEAVKKQLAAHVAAEAALPGTTDGQVYRAAQSNKMALRALGVGYWKRMHDLLDGEFGEGQEAFTAKSAFGYERRLRSGGSSRRKRGGEKKPVVGGGGAPAGADASKGDAKKEAAAGKPEVAQG